MAYAYLFKYIIIGDTGKGAECEPSAPEGETAYVAGRALVYPRSAEVRDVLSQAGCSSVCEMGRAT